MLPYAVGNAGFAFPSMLCLNAKGTGNGYSWFYTGMGFDSLQCPTDQFDIYMKAHVNCL